MRRTSRGKYTPRNSRQRREGPRIAHVITCSGQDPRSTLKFPHLRIHTPYDHQFLAKLKFDIPWQARRWNPELSGWEIQTSQPDLITRLCEEFFDDVEEENEQLNPNTAPLFPTQDDTSVDTLRQFLFEFCPEDIHKTIYREATKLCHPDSGGTAEQFKEMMELWEKVKKEFR